MKKALKTSPEGRRCIHPDCERLLSIYNHHSYCRVHQEQLTLEEKERLNKHPYKSSETRVI